ncbi:hypothetical protein DFH09DRAFT_1347902 [Mycena vulgaris]|nr:hypothetical protein DFH09DRAFT_1347902 [Mycena vulgaris]
MSLNSVPTTPPTASAASSQSSQMALEVATASVNRLHGDTPIKELDVFLGQLQQLADVKGHGVYFHPSTVGFTDKVQKANNEPFLHDDHSLQDTFGSLHRPTDRPTCEATIYLVATWVHSWVGTDWLKGWAQDDHHAWVIIVLHGPPKKRAGKQMVVYDPNTGQFDPEIDGAHEILSPRARAFKETFRHVLNYPPERIWVNEPEEQPNWDGRCMPLTGRFLLRLATEGLGLVRDASGMVQGIRGFIAFQRMNKKKEGKKKKVPIDTASGPRRSQRFKSG